MKDSAANSYIVHEEWTSRVCLLPPSSPSASWGRQWMPSVLLAERSKVSAIVPQRVVPEGLMSGTWSRALCQCVNSLSGIAESSSLRQERDPYLYLCGEIGVFGYAIEIFRFYRYFVRRPLCLLCFLHHKSKNYNITAKPEIRVN